MEVVFNYTGVEKDHPFYSYETPEQFYALDLTRMGQDELQDLAYFIWCVYENSDEKKLLSWREKEVLPLLEPLTPSNEVLDEL